MIKKIAYRLASCIAIWLLLCWVCLWMMDVIPGHLQDFYADETNNNTQSALYSENKSLPLFYFGWIPETAMTPYAWPDFKWHGLHNRFHQLLSHYWRGDFGKSYKDNRAVKEIIAERLTWTLALQLPALFFIIALSFILAWQMSLRPDSMFWKWTRTSLLALHSLPTFWLASVLMIFFATPDFLNWFPAQAHGVDAESTWEIWLVYPAYLLLPVASIVIPSLSFLGRLLENGFKEARQRKHWTKAIAIGMDERTALRTQGLPWAMVPFLGWLAGVLPWMFSGALVVENIFSIPGLGRLLLQSITMRDWPVTTALFLLIAAATMLGLLLADWLLYYIDPRTRHERR